MKSILTFLLLSIAVCMAQTPIGIKQNTFTTNKDPSFAITNAVAGFAPSQQYFVVTNAGEIGANGNYFLDPTYPSSLLVWTNSTCFIWEGAPNLWLLSAPSSIPYSGYYLYIAPNGLNSWTNVDSNYPWIPFVGAPPFPKITIAYTGAASYITPSLLQNAGGLTVSNFSQYADTNGGGSVLNPLFQTFFPPSNTNLTTQTQLATATNNLSLALQSYAPPVMTNIDNTIYSNNPSHYITPSATNGITRLGLSVVSVITNSDTNFTVSSSQTATGIVYTVTLNTNNITYITNINALTLESRGVLTTNKSSWQNYVAPINDWTNAHIYTNGLISITTAASTFQMNGSYLTPTNNLKYSEFTNAPAIPTTNQFVTASITNGFATTNWTQAQNYLTPSLISYYALTSSVISAVAPYPTITTLNTSSNFLRLENITNVNAIALHWGTNQALVGSIAWNSNMTATFTTNNGVITVTLGSTTNLYTDSILGLQPSASNLTNWSTVGTNRILLTPNLVTWLASGNNVNITYTTNSSGIHATVNSYYQYNSPIQVASANITYSFFSATNWYYYFSSGAVNWGNPLPATPTTLKIYQNGSDITSLVKSVLTNWSQSATGFNGTGYKTSGGLISGTVQVVGICD
jgi:hypothetical protein